MRLRRILNHPALLDNGRRKTLIVADLHIGIVSFPDRVVDDVVDLVKSTRAEKLIVVGDAKHDVGKRFVELKAWQELVEKLEAEGVEEVLLIQGNHDGGLEAERCVIERDTAFFHGHFIPDEVLEARRFVIAHAHPAVFIADEVSGFKERIWLEGLVEIGGEMKEIIVMPAFNELCSSTAVNVERPAGALFRLWNYSKAEITLLDGTYLGRVEQVKV
jgi:hypothetical protein